jgi:hypothetical protein
MVAGYDPWGRQVAWRDNMTEPDEVYAAWEACACDRYEDEENGNPLGLPQGMPNFADFRDGYRAGQAASAERIKALEELIQKYNAARALLKEADQ